MPPCFVGSPFRLDPRLVSLVWSRCSAHLLALSFHDVHPCSERSAYRTPSDATPWFYHVHTALSRVLYAHNLHTLGSAPLHSLECAPPPTKLLILKEVDFPPSTIYPRAVCTLLSGATHKQREALPALRARLPSASLRPAFGRLMMTRHRRGLDAIEPLRGCAS